MVRDGRRVRPGGRDDGLEPDVGKVDAAIEALGNLWIGCGCLFLLGIVVIALLMGISRGGEVALISGLLLLGIVGYLAWAHQSNQPRR